MKGDVEWLYPLMIVLISAMLLISYITYTTASGGTTSSKSYTEGKSMFSKQSYSEFKLDPSGFLNANEYQAHFSSDEYCEKVKNAIVRVMVTGVPQTVDVVSYKGSGLDDRTIENIYPEVSCTPEQLNLSLGPEVWQKVCDYKNIGTWSEWDTFQYNGLDFDSCNFIEDEIVKESLPFSFTSPTYDIRTYRCNDYFHHFKSTTSLYTPGNGPGIIKIKIGKARDFEGCSFTMRLCMQPAFVEYDTDSITDVFDIFANLELYQILLDDIPYYITKENVISTTTFKPGANIFHRYIITDKTIEEVSEDLTITKYSWGKQTIKLDKGYSITELSNAIIMGFTKNPADYQWIPGSSWVIKDIILTGYRSALKKDIEFDCGSDKICSGKIDIEIYVNKFKFATLDTSGGLEEPPQFSDSFFSAYVKVKEVV